MSVPATLPELLEAAAAAHGERPFFPGMSYAEVARRSAAVSRALAGRGVAPGEVVGLLSPNRPEWALAFFGILGAGASVLPLDPHLTPAELDHLLAEFGVSRVLGRDLPLEPEGAGPVDLPAPDPSGLAVLIASSGTTGRPKGIQLSHANLLTNVRQFRQAIPFGPEDAFLGLLPFHHAFPLTGCLLAAVSSGARVVVPESMRPPQLLGSIAEGGVTVALVVPGILRLLLKASERDGDREAFGPALRILFVGGAPCPMALLEAGAAMGLPVLQGYGMSEASPVIAINAPGADRPGTVGRPVPGVEVRIDGAPEGEVLVRGPNVMLGYFRDPARTAEVLKGGWLHTGDIGILDADGYLTLRGRAKNVIVTESGKNVYPEEIEAELAKSDRLREACVVGRPAEGSERITAVVVLAPGVSEAEARAEVRERCLSLADYKRPQEVVSWRGEALPRTASGKVKVAAVREALSR